MSNRFNELYQKYIADSLSKEEIVDFLSEAGQASDDELWEVMEDCDNASEETPMSLDVKSQHMAIMSKLVHKKNRNLIFRYVAAVALILTSLPVIYWIFNEKVEKQQLAEVHVAPGNKATIVLQDGTKVVLNSGTVLQYEVKPGKSRYARLVQGEAYFDVTKDASCPFDVEVDKVNIKVLGTKFNVKQNGAGVQTSLFTGSVKLTVDDSDLSYQMTPGEKTIFDSSSNKLQLSRNDEIIDAGWKDGYLSFKSLSLQNVISRIEEWYGVKIVVQNVPLQDDLMTGSFHQETLESVLKSICMQYGLRYEYHNNAIVLKVK